MADPFTRARGNPAPAGEVTGEARREPAHSTPTPTATSTATATSTPTAAALQTLPGSVSFRASRMRLASAGSSPPISTARSTMDRPLATEAFTISAARA